MISAEHQQGHHPARELVQDPDHHWFPARLPPQAARGPLGQGQDPPRHAERAPAAGHRCQAQLRHPVHPRHRDVVADPELRPQDPCSGRKMKKVVTANVGLHIGRYERKFAYSKNCQIYSSKSEKFPYSHFQEISVFQFRGRADCHQSVIVRMRRIPTAEKGILMDSNKFVNDSHRFLFDSF